MIEHVGFLRALSADPRGDLNRLVYADWLEERGEPLAELLRLQVAIPAAPTKALVHLVERERQLQQQHGDDWADLVRSLALWPDACLKLEVDVLELSSRDPLGSACLVCGQPCWRWGPGNPMMLHWVVNPGLAFNELVLGQRIPREMFICRDCRVTFLRCVACRRFQPLIGELNRPGGMWNGLNCPDCGAAFPMLRNLLGGAILGLGKLALLPWRGKRRPARAFTRAGRGD
jgi:uncharacterized protein (TIGR02996 family)